MKHAWTDFFVVFVYVYVVGSVDCLQVEQLH